MIHLPKLGYVPPPPRLQDEENVSKRGKKKMRGHDFDEKLVQREHLEVRPSEMDFSKICDDDQPPDLEPVV